MLADLLPGKWVPLYTLISHTTVPYAEAIARAKKQNRVARLFGADLLLLVLTAALISRDGFMRFKQAFTSFFERPIEVPKLEQSKLIRNSQFTTER
jgi:hypothetical protein